MKNNDHKCDEFLIAAFTESGPITQCSLCGAYGGSGIKHFDEYKVCGKCGCLIHQQYWIKMGKLIDYTEVCEDCYKNQTGTVLY